MQYFHEIGANWVDFARNGLYCPNYLFTFGNKKNLGRIPLKDELVEQTFSSNTKLSRNKWTCFLILLLLSSLLKELLYWYHQFSFFRIFGRSAIQMSSSPSNLNPLPPSIIESAWCERPIFANDHLPYISCSILFVKMGSLEDARFFFILGVSVFACLSVSVCVCECVCACMCECLCLCLFALFFSIP